MEYLLIDQSMLDSYRDILLDYIKTGFDLAFPVFTVVAGVALFVFIIVYIVRNFS